MRRTTLAGFGMICCVMAFAAPLMAQEPAAEGWKDDFERLCGKTLEAESMGVGELQSLISDCDDLIAALKERNNPREKVYVFRLDKCREFYAYMIEVNGTMAQGESK